MNLIPSWRATLRRRRDFPGPRPRPHGNDGAFPSIHRRAFSLTELLTATAILAVLLLIVVGILEATQSSMQRSRDRVSQFRDARIGFELITRNLSQASLQTYWDYRYASTGTNLPAGNTPVPEQPSAYVRQSELHFLVDQGATLLEDDQKQGHACFFQAPLGDSDRYPNLDSLLNGRGYYVVFGDDSASRPGFIGDAAVPLKHRFRLMEFRPAAESDDTSDAHGNSVYVNPLWYRDQLERVSRPVAENIVALFFSPRTSPQAEAVPGSEPFAIAPQYHYDSRARRNRGAPASSPETQHLLPPLVQVTMIAIDNASARRLAALHGNRTPSELAVPAGAFEDAALYDADLAAYVEKLASYNINYRVLTATVPIRAAKWSEALAPPKPSPSP